MMRLMRYANVHDFTDENDLWDNGWPELAYAHEGDAGLDLRAMESHTIEPGGWVTVGTGVALEVPKGCQAQVVPRSGLASKHGITVLNSPGTIDSNYRGEIGVILLNLGREPFHVSPGDRIAQLVVTPFVSCRLEHVAYEDLEETERGADGFGSTGLR